VITASLYARMRSRGNGQFADRVLAALRNQFGGHAVRSAAPEGAVSGQAKPTPATPAQRRGGN
jgi:6-phosphogluconate dehydrogenase